MSATSVSAAFLDADKFETKDDKIIKDSQHNIRLALLKLGVRLTLDVFADRMLIEGGDFETPSFVDDGVIEHLWLKVDSQFLFRPTKDFFYTVTREVARQNRFHPVLDYLDGLRWDGIPRLEKWLVEFGGAEDSPYVRAVSRLVLVAAVRRVRDPGAKFDEMLILESGQGKAEKSSALAALCPKPSWFSDDLPLGADAKVVIERTSGKWIIEAAELDGIKGAGVERLKAFLSRRADVARPAYGRLPREHPRHFVVIGTTNSTTYLRDITGNRRFWPVPIKKFDTPGLTNVRSQLWAEAQHEEKQGVSIRLAENLWEEAGRHQEARRAVDPWEERLEHALGDQVGKISSSQVWGLVGFTETYRQSQEDNVRLGGIMQRLGFERKKARHNGRVCFHYMRGEPSERENEIVPNLYA